jgi:septum formation protein
MDSTAGLLVLASQSPRRAELLTKAGYRFIVTEPDPDAEEQAPKNFPPRRLVVELAKCKAQNVVSKVLKGSDGVHNLQSPPECPSPHKVSMRTVVLAADTVALCEGQVLGKPVDREDALKMLRQLSGRQHQVLTGVCLWDVTSKRHLERLSVTTLKMDDLTDSQLESFLQSGDWQGKAGGFGYQDGLEWLQIVEGLESNVVGLPVENLPAWIQELWS